MTKNMISLSDDILLLIVSYLDKKSLQKLARSRKAIFQLVAPLARQLISVSRRSKQIRKALEACRYTLQFVWNPIGNNSIPLDEYDFYIPKIMISGLLSALSVNDYVALLENTERWGWGGGQLAAPLIGDPAKRRQAAQRLVDLHLHAINARDPEVLNQLGLKAFQLSKGKREFIIFFAVYCFAELVLSFPSFSRGKKNLFVAVKTTEAVWGETAFGENWTREYYNFPFFHSQEEIFEVVRATSLHK